MKSIRVVMMMTLLATATAVSAQTAPQAQQYDLPSLPCPLQDVQAVQTAQPTSECPFAKALQDANVAWQRLRAMCGAAKTAGCGEPSCGMSNVCKGTGCGTGSAGCAKGGEAAQPPATCCCAKACACCETCKTVKAKETVQVEQVPIPPTPLACPFAMMPPLAGWKMQCGSGVVQIVAQPMSAPPANCYMAVSMPAKSAPAKLVTPDFEAHCDQMIQKGNTIELVGNVLLLCKKHAQPLRIEGQRVIVNLTDGSFVVEAGLGAPSHAPAVNMMRPTSSLAAPPCLPSQCMRAMPIPERVEQIIRLRNVPAVDVANAINVYLEKTNAIFQMNGQGAAVSEATVVAEPITNSLAVKCSPQEFDKIFKIIGHLDKVGQCPSGSVCPNTTGIIEVVPVPHAVRPR